MKALTIIALLGAGIASCIADDTYGVAQECGTTLDLCPHEMKDVEFQNILGKTTDNCKFTITAPKTHPIIVGHCEGDTVTVEGQDANTFEGNGALEIVFNPATDSSLVKCWVALKGAHVNFDDLLDLLGVDGENVSLENFQALFHIVEKDPEAAAAALAANQQIIAAINHGNSTFTAAINEFSDLNFTTFLATHTGKRPHLSRAEQERRSARAETELLAPLRAMRTTLPSSVDLTASGRISPVKSQGNCGSCSIFAAVATIESCFHKVTDRPHVDLSEQQILDCAYGYQGAGGCRGASADIYHQWMYARHNGGLAKETDYSYDAVRGTCRTVGNAITGAKVSSHQESWNAAETDIMTILAAGMPVTSGVYVNNAFQSYSDGVLKDDSCQNCRLADGSRDRSCRQNHDVVIVGYGEENGEKYWKIKNSWGSGWGDQGFLKMLRGPGHCGIGVDFSLPLCTDADTTPTTAAPTTAAPPPSGGCGGTLSGKSSGMIRTQPRPYDNDMSCTWIIEPFEENKVVKLTFRKVNIEASRTCRYDYLQLLNKDGSAIDVTSEQITGPAAAEGKICGRQRPMTVYSKDNGAIVKFVTDSSVRKAGVVMKYEFVDPPVRSCKNQRVSTYIGVAPATFSTLDYPADYKINAECDWTVSVPDGQKVTLSFDEFSTEEEYDTVSVFDGSDASSPVLLDEHSGDSIPEEVTSTGNKLFVLFTSDFSITDKGFKAKATAVN